MTSKPPGLPVFSGVFLQLCLKWSRPFAGLELVQDNRTVRDRLGFQCCRDGQFCENPSHPAHISYNEAKHRVLQRLPEHMCSWRAGGLGWGAGSPGGPAPHPGPSSLQQDAPGLRGEVICLRLRQRHTACTVTLHKLNCTRSGRERGEECNSLNATGHSGYHLTERVSLREQVGPCASL